MKFFNKRPFLLLFGSILLASGYAISAGDNPNHELMVYSLEEYQEFYDDCKEEYSVWKPTIYLLWSNQDPYEDFWEEMYTNCTGSQCAKANDSVRRKDQEVTVNSMVDLDDGWEDADMIFFYGHNTQIKPHMHHEFDLWRPVGEFDWCQFHIDDYIDWGTTAEPYRYHQRFIYDATDQKQYAVFYAYNALTSVLVAQDYSFYGLGGWWRTENTKFQRIPDTHWGLLGPETEWVVAHGCNAVQVAKYEDDTPGDDIIPTHHGVAAWSKSWDRLHLVLGHYRIITTGTEPNLNLFAADLKSGDTIKDAYFDMHNAGDSDDPAYAQPSAISISPIGCCHLEIKRLDGWPYFIIIFVCPPEGCENAYMNSDTWLHPLPDLPIGEMYYYTTSWKEYEM